jgi:hypothetical protein
MMIAMLVTSWEIAPSKQLFCAGKGNKGAAWRRLWTGTRGIKLLNTFTRVKYVRIIRLSAAQERSVRAISAPRQFAGKPDSADGAGFSWAFPMLSFRLT